MISVSNSQKEYLKAIHFLSFKSDVSITSIAKQLDVSKPSVINALKNLDEMKLVVYNHDVIKLTSIGMRYAMNIFRKDDVLKRFFINVLKVDSDLAIKDAFNMKNSVSCQTISKLEKYLIEKEGLNEVNYHEYCICEHDKKGCVSCDKN